MKKYTTYKAPAIVLTLFAAFGWGLQVFSSPSGFKLDSFVIILIGLLIFILLDLLYGSYVFFKDGLVTHVESFLFKKAIPVDEIESIRYQPTYGIAKEVSSLYVFKKGQNTAAFTMTSIWYGEKTLSIFARDLKLANPRIEFDDEAKVLLERNQSYFDAQKIQAVPFLLGIVGVVGGILLFIKAQSSITEEFNLINHGLASISTGLIAGFGTYTLLRRSNLSLLVGILVSCVFLGIYWFSTN